MAYTVYMHINKVNGRKYIGITKNRPSKRWRGGQGYKFVKGDFYEDIQTYGWNSFEHQIVAEGLSEEEAVKIGRELVEKYNTTNPEYGYNLTQGGRSGAYGNRNGISKSVIGTKGEERIEFSSAEEAAKSVGGHRSNIINCCKGKIKSAYGWYWQYRN